jgi:hypothetical protein
VKTTPAATDSPAEPVVCTILLRRICGSVFPIARVMARKIVIESTAMGIEALTVSPTFRARYTLDAAKTRPRMHPRTTAPTVISVRDFSAAT